MAVAMLLKKMPAPRIVSFVSAVVGMGSLFCILIVACPIRTLQNNTQRLSVSP